MRLVATICLLCLILLLIPANDAQAGEADEILLGFVFGTSFGILLGGGALIFYRNPDADRSIETVMITAGLIGATGGIVFGTLLPDDAVENDPVVGFLLPRSKTTVSLKSPTFAIAPIREGDKIRPGAFANLIRLEF